MPEYTPTTTEARALYVTGTPRDISVAEGNAEFDRWLAAHDAEVLASRDAEVEELERQDEADRQNHVQTMLEYEALREQLAAAEARAGKVWDYVTKPLTWQESLSRDFAGKPMARFVDRDEIAALMLNLSPTMALAAHDREVAARTLEAVASDLDVPRTVWHGDGGVSVMTDERKLTRVPLTKWLLERAAEIRAGEDR